MSKVVKLLRNHRAGIRKHLIKQLDSHGTGLALVNQTSLNTVLLCWIPSPKDSFYHTGLGTGDAPVFPPACTSSPCLTTVLCHFSKRSNMKQMPVVHRPFSRDLPCRHRFCAVSFTQASSARPAVPGSCAIAVHTSPGLYGAMGPGGVPCLQDLHTMAPSRATSECPTSIDRSRRVPIGASRARGLVGGAVWVGREEGGVVCDWQRRGVGSCAWCVK